MEACGGNMKKRKKPSILQRNELHEEVVRNTRGVIHKDKSKEIPRKQKYKKSTRDYLRGE